MCRCLFSHACHVAARVACCATCARLRVHDCCNTFLYAVFDAGVRVPTLDRHILVTDRMQLRVWLATKRVYLSVCCVTWPACMCLCLFSRACRVAARVACADACTVCFKMCLRHACLCLHFFAHACRVAARVACSDACIVCFKMCLRHACLCLHLFRTRVSCSSAGGLLGCVHSLFQDVFEARVFVPALISHTRVM
jgi:hypothetical protein